MSTREDRLNEYRLIAFQKWINLIDCGIQSDATLRSCARAAEEAAQAQVAAEQPCGGALTEREAIAQGIEQAGGSIPDGEARGKLAAYIRAGSFPGQAKEG